VLTFHGWMYGFFLFSDDDDSGRAGVYAFFVFSFHFCQLCDTQVFSSLPFLSFSLFREHGSE